MIIFKKADQLQNWLQQQRKNNKKIGFVPTMGALHNGHLALMKTCIDENDWSVCSIFVNPTQFNNPNDFEKYPITTENDILLLEKVRCQVLFLPSVDEVYQFPINAPEKYDIGNLENVFEGVHRPGHFQGVCMVVHRLLQIVQPSTLYLGQKDFQQCMVIEALVKSLHLPVTIRSQATIRELDGLAMSSRNMRLSAEGRKKAVAMYQNLQVIAENIVQTPISILINNAIEKLTLAGFSKVEYIAVCLSDTLKEVTEYHKGVSYVIVAAAWIENIRLIDNILIKE